VTPRTTEAEREAEAEQDERNARFSRGCLGEGCILGAAQASSVIMLIWILV